MCRGPARSRSRQGHPLSPTAHAPTHVPTRQPTQYGVAPNSAILAEEQHQPLFKELVDDYAVKYIAGGATQNSCRVCQWMTAGTPGATSYFGCIGDDAFGKQMTDEAAAIGMNVQYLVDPEQVRGEVTRLWCMVRHPCMLTDRRLLITDD